MELITVDQEKSLASQIVKPPALQLRYYVAEAVISLVRKTCCVFKRL